MADYLKDTQLQYLTIESNDLDTINDEVNKIYQDALQLDNTLQLQYLIRYDGMGIIRTDFSEIKSCFEKAKKVERLFFTISSKAPDYFNRKKIEIRLDKDNSVNSLLVVTDNDESWVDSKFKHLEARLNTFKNKNKYVHSNLFDFIVQILGVLVGLLISVILSSLLESKISIKNSFFILFITSFLMFSNLWTYILNMIKRLRDNLWENISFKRKPIGWIGQTIIASVIGLIVAGLLKISWDLIIKLSEKIIEKS